MSGRWISRRVILRTRIVWLTFTVCVAVQFARCRLSEDSPPFPQGLKPLTRQAFMSEPKLRPPKNSPCHKYLCGGPLSQAAHLRNELKAKLPLRRLVLEFFRAIFWQTQSGDG